MMDLKIEQEGSMKTLIVSGDMTVQNVKELKGVLIESLDDTDHIVMDLNGVVEVDLSCLQLLCSAHKTLAEMNKKITLGNNCTEQIRETVKSAGFLKHMGCGSECDENCLWFNCKCS